MKEDIWQPYGGLFILKQKDIVVWFDWFLINILGVFIATFDINFIAIFPRLGGRSTAISDEQG